MTRNNPVFKRTQTQRNYDLHKEVHSGRAAPFCPVCGDYEYRLMNKSRRDSE